MLNVFDYDLWYLILNEMYYNPELYLDTAVEKLYKENTINDIQYNKWMNSPYHNIACDYAKLRYDIVMERLCLDNPPLDICCFCPFKVENLFQKDCLSNIKNKIYNLTDQINNNTFETKKVYFRNQIIEERQRLIYMLIFFTFRESVVVLDTYYKINNQYTNLRYDTMGYMSEVAICMTSELFNQMNEKANIELSNENLIHYRNLLKNTTINQTNDNCNLLYWEQVKWYVEVDEYDYITFINTFIKESIINNPEIENKILFIKIGTDDLDTEIIGNFYDNPFDLYLIRKIHIREKNE